MYFRIECVKISHTLCDLTVHLVIQVGEFANCLIEARTELQHK